MNSNLSMFHSSKQRNDDPAKFTLSLCVNDFLKFPTMDGKDVAMDFYTS